MVKCIFASHLLLLSTKHFNILLLTFKNDPLWMDLETVTQSEVSQKEKNEYRMLTHIYGI